VSESAIATAGWGIVRDGCTDMPSWNAWLCPGQSVSPARLIIESLDSDTETRSLVPVALASGGYVDLLNGGQDHGWCFGYTCLKRLSTFHSTVVSNRTYDLTFAGTNPQSLRLMMPTDAGAAVLLAVWYASPNKLVVYDADGQLVPDLNPTPYGDNLARPVLGASGCGANAFIGVENKLLLYLCGGDGGLTIRTVPTIVLSIGVEVSEEEFFEPEFVARNIISLLDISPDRVRVVSATSASGRRLSSSGTRRLGESGEVQLEISAADKCDGVRCGEHGSCREEGVCVCTAGVETPSGCDGNYCQCSVLLNSTTCAGAACGGEGAGCAAGTFSTAKGCQLCDPSCALCDGGDEWSCTACRAADTLEQPWCAVCVRRSRPRWSSPRA